MNEAMEEQEINQYLTFKLGDELFGVDVLKAREVLDCLDITKVPQTPEYMMGVINLRGRVAPVIDLRRKFGMPAVDQTEDTCIVVMDIESEDEHVVIGALVDAVEEVLDLDERLVEPPPRLGPNIRSDFIRGMGNLDGQFIILLNIDRVFSAGELDDIQSEDVCREVVAS